MFTVLNMLFLSITVNTFHCHFRVNFSKKAIPSTFHCTTRIPKLTTYHMCIADIPAIITNWALVFFIVHGNHISLMRTRSTNQGGLVIWAHPGVARLGMLAVSWAVMLLLAGALSGPGSVASFTRLGAGGPGRPGGPGSCSHFNIHKVFVCFFPILALVLSHSGLGYLDREV